MTPVLVGETVSPLFAEALREIGRVGAGGDKVANGRRPRAGFVGGGRRSGSQRSWLLTTVCVNPGAIFFKMRPWILLPPSPTCFSGSGRNGDSRTRCSRSGRDCTRRQFHCWSAASGSRVSARSSCSRPGWRSNPSGSCAKCESSDRSCRHDRYCARKRALMLNAQAPIATIRRQPTVDLTRLVDLATRRRLPEWIRRRLAKTGQSTPRLVSRSSPSLGCFLS